MLPQYRGHGRSPVHGLRSTEGQGRTRYQVGAHTRLVQLGEQRVGRRASRVLSQHLGDRAVRPPADAVGVQGGGRLVQGPSNEPRPQNFAQAVGGPEPGPLVGEVRSQLGG